MPDVIWRSNRPNLRSTLSHHPAGMAAIEDRNKSRLVRQLTIEIEKVIVGESCLPRPVKVIRHQTFIESIDCVPRTVAGDLRSVAAVKKKAHVTGLWIVEQPGHSFAHSFRGRTLIQNHPNRVSRKVTFL